MRVTAIIKLERGKKEDLNFDSQNTILTVKI